MGNTVYSVPPDAYRDSEGSLWIRDDTQCGDPTYFLLEEGQDSCRLFEGSVARGSIPLWFTEQEPPPVEPTGFGAVIKVGNVRYQRQARCAPGERGRWWNVDGYWTKWDDLVKKNEHIEVIFEGAGK